LRGQLSLGCWAGDARLDVALGGTLAGVELSDPSRGPSAEKPPLSDEERAGRLQLLAERLRSPDGLDRELLAQIEAPDGQRAVAAWSDLGRRPVDVTTGCTYRNR